MFVKNTIPIYLTVILVFLGISSGFTQTEICNNGLDDDGDGLVDCFDGDCAGNNLCVSHFTNGVIPDCPDTPNVAQFSMRLQWTSTAGEDYVTPVVGDLDGDGIPEIVTVNYGNGRLYVLNGQDGSTITNISYPNTYHNFAGGSAIADIDNDGTAEIFLVVGNNQTSGTAKQWIVCWDYDNGTLTQRYKKAFGRFGNTSYSDQKWAVVQFADFDQDGVTELFIGNHVMNSATGDIIASPTTAQRNSWSRGRIPKSGQDFRDYMSAAYDVLPADSCANCEGLELICGNTIYAVDLSDPGNDQNGITIATQITPTGTYTDGLTSLSDWDGDGKMDVIVTGFAGGTANFYIWDPRADTVIIDRTNIPNSGINGADWGAGRATVADFDGDGINELAIVSRNRLNLFEHDGSLKWFAAGSDLSQKTSATAFDFEGDGNMEVIYRDDSNLKILDGTTGAVKDVLGCSSGTRVEMPVIADVDADGEAEICVSCGSNTRVYTSDQTPWMPTRKVWNSLHYSPTFINDNLTIPAHRQDKAAIPGLDIYAAQVPITDPAGNLIYPALPDFVVAFDSSTVGDCTDDSTAVFVTICNDDAAALKYDYPLSFYDGDPSSGGTLLGTRTVTIANSTPTTDSCYQFTFNAPNQPIDLYVIANDDGTGTFGYPTTSLLECDSSNNVANGEIGCPIDAEITKDDGELHYIPGGARTYQIVARSNGSSFTGGIVSDPLPAGISAGDVTWTATTYGGATTTASGTMNGALQDTVDIPGGDSIVYSVTISTPDNLAGDLVNVVSINVVGDTITDNNIATDTDTVDCTFSIAGTVNSRHSSWTQIGTVVGGFTYNFSTAGGTKTFTPGSGPESGQQITTVVYNTGTGFSVSLSRHRYNNSNVYHSTLTHYDPTPHGWTGLSGIGYEQAPVLGFMAFVDRNGNGSFDSGTDDFIRDVNTLSINPVNSGELYMAFYDDGLYSDNNGLINIESSVDPIAVDFGAADSVVCAGDSIQLDAGNSNAVSWDWSNGESTQVIQAKTTGEYSVVVTTPGGCQAVDTMDIIVEEVTVNLGNDTSLCTDSTYILDAGNPSATSWVWSDGNTTQLDTVNSANTYSVIVTNSNGCVGYDTIVVTQIPQLDLAFGNDTSICIGESINLTFTKPDGASQLWNTGSTAQTITVDSAASYSVLVIDSNGCPNHDTIVLSLDTLPVVALGNDTTICQDSTVTITSPVGTNWSWNTGENTQSISIDSAGVYDVTVTDANGCVNYDTLEVSIASGANINLGNDTNICAGDTLFLDAGNGTSWTWSSLQNTQTIAVTTANTYIVDVTYASGCTFSDTIDLVVNPLPVFDLGNDTAICEYSNLTLNAQTGTDWLWSTGATTQSINASVAQDYSVIVTDANDCINYDTISLSITPSPLVNLGNDTSICASDSIQFSIATGISWIWNGGNTTSSLTAFGPDTISVIVSDGNCETFDTIVIGSNPLPIVDLGPDATICEGTTLELDAANNGSSFLWQDNSTLSTFTVSDEGTYSVRVTNSNLCVGNDTVQIDTSSTPSKPLINPQEVRMCDAIGETATLEVQNHEGMDIEWSTAETTIEIEATIADEYIVTKTNAYDCSATDTAEVIQECETVTITLPNVFTPNDDGTNETFIPLENPVDLLTYIDDINFIVYNRWGRAMFESQGLLPKWDGKFLANGKDCPTGVYYWVVEYTTVTGESERINGFVQLIKE